MSALNFTFHGIGAAPSGVRHSERPVWVSQPDFCSALDAIQRLDGAEVTFDDGNSSDRAIALPALLERGMSGRFFVVAGRLGLPGYLSSDDLGALYEAGMQIGVHGMRHRSWRGLADDDLQEETLESKRELEAHLGARLTSAACPFGAYDRRVLGALRRAGFARVFTSDGGYASPEAWLQPRNTLLSGSDARTIDLVARRSWSVSGRLRRAKILVKSSR
jgi:peptidoglycan/xylan/chitin deacetylase (PgdA/CDA1 family)